MNRDVLPVGAVVELLRGALRVHHLFSDLWVTGEVVSATVARGNCFFALGDEEGQLRGVLWRAGAVRQAHALRPGMQVAVHGYLDLYPARGELQIVVDSVQPAGLGLAALEFERLRAQLEAEGLFDPSRKRPIPAVPRCIGVVTSESGAVWHDIQTVLRRRWPMTQVILSPTRVQGEGAPESIAAALGALERDGRSEVIIVARGGGAPEDLAAFNSETVVRAIFACPVPVVSGVGHETDVTLADFVADLRAATPSAAAELCTPSAAVAIAQVRALRASLGGAMAGKLGRAAEELAASGRRLALAAPERDIRSRRLRVAALSESITRSWQAWQAARTASVAGQARALRALDPAAVLARGYAVITPAGSDAPLVRAVDASAGMAIHARLAEGGIDAWITQTYPPKRKPRGATAR